MTSDTAHDFVSFLNPLHTHIVAKPLLRTVWEWMDRALSTPPTTLTFCTFLMLNKL